MRGNRFINLLGTARVAAPPPSSLGIVANRFQIPTSGVATTAPQTCRRSHWSSADGAISNFSCIDVGFFMSVTTPTPSSTYQIKRYIEYPVGVFTQVTWGGLGSVTVASGGTPTVSDPVPVTIPANTQFWERTVLLASVAGTLPCINPTNSSLIIGTDDGKISADNGNSGTVPASAAFFFFGAAAMVGTIAAANARSFVCTGDSILFGSSVAGSLGAGDVSNSSPKQSSGWVGRMLDIHGYPYFKIASPGQTAASFASSVGVLTPLINALSFTDVICEHIVNDITGGASQAAILASQQTIYSLVPGKRIRQTTSTPRVPTSTDGWTTTGGQTPDAFSAVRNGTAAAIRALPANVTAALDAADAAMSARDSDIWATPPAPTTDGTHSNSVASAAMAAFLAGTL